MKLLLVDNIHLFKGGDGKYYSPSIYNLDFFERYLAVFDSIGVIAKIRNVDSELIHSMELIDDERIQIIALPWFRGIRGLFRSLPRVYPIIRKATFECNCAILRTAQVESILTFMLIKHKSLPIAAEVVNDPGSFVNVHPFMRSLLVFWHKRIIKAAIGVSYVTQFYLQNKYPCRASNVNSNGKCFTTNYSSTGLRIDEVSLEHKQIHGSRVVMVHSANHFVDDSKGHKVVIDILVELRKRGLDVRAKFIGDGPARNDYQEHAKNKGVLSFVEFIGKVSNRGAYLSEIRTSDVFVFPSLFEGLPRVVIEALACGVPVVASRVGGTSELIDERWLFDPNDVEGFTDSIEMIIRDEDLYQQLSKAGIKKALDYTNKTLQDRRTAFYYQLAQNCK